MYLVHGHGWKLYCFTIVLPLRTKIVVQKGLGTTCLFWLLIRDIPLHITNNDIFRVKRLCARSNSVQPPSGFPNHFPLSTMTKVNQDGELFWLAEKFRYMQLVVWLEVYLFCKLGVLQEVISIVTYSLRRRWVANCKNKLRPATAPFRSWQC